MLVMELVRGGTLADFIEDRRAKNEKFTHAEASAILKSIVKGVAYMHEKGIVHRDLKPGQSLKTRGLNFIREHPY